MKPANRATPQPAVVDVKAIRARTGLTQPEFASRLGFSLWAIREWEQGGRPPEKAARALLILVDKWPEAVIEALAAANP